VPGKPRRCALDILARRLYRLSAMSDHVREPDVTTPDGRLALQLKALAHPARLRILEILAAERSCVCGRIVEVMPLAQATVSQHLKVLKEAGLVDGRIDGPRSCYCIDAAALAALRRALDTRLARLLAGEATPEPLEEIR
jgi:ArsR family transcriptional regulator